MKLLFEGRYKSYFMNIECILVKLGKDLYFSTLDKFCDKQNLKKIARTNPLSSYIRKNSEKSSIFGVF